MEMTEAAAEQGFTAIGISDHLVLHPTLDTVFWAMELGRLDDYVNTISEYKLISPIPLFMGLEVDFFQNNPRQAELDDILAKYTFDYLIGSIHFLDDFPIDYLASDWEALTQSEINDKHRSYWATMKALVTSQQFDFIGHLDLIKKMGFDSTEDLSETINEVLEVIAQNNLIIEINCAGWNKKCAEMYPSLDILSRALALNIPIIMNDDAHKIEQLGQHYGKSLANFNRLAKPTNNLNHVISSPVNHLNLTPL